MKLVRNKIILLLLSLLVLGGVVFAYLEMSGKTNFIGERKESQEEAKSNLQKKSDLVTPGTTSTNTPTNNAKQPSDGKPFVAPTGSEGITLNAFQSDASEVVVSTKLAGYSDGVCKLTVSNGSKTTSQTAAVMFQREYSTCAGFRIPVDTVGAGLWDIKLEVTSGNVTNSKSTTLEVK